MTIYRKYRAQNFKEIVGQEHVVQILKQAVIESKFAHAYLFTGPRGTGKTSMARILSKALNCLNPENGEPCNKCRNCLAINSGRFMDLIEIDAASNRGIDEIRGLKEGISFMPVEGKYKIYIIDEVHMLTEPAFNALLKTLEEPPQQVLFILATTEPHKLPLTIISRTQRFDFKLADTKNLNTKLSRILKSEEVAIAPEALDIVIKAGQGSYRDAETVLEKILSAVNIENKGQTISKEMVESILGYVSSAKINDFIRTLIKNDRKGALDIIHEAMADGANMAQFLKETLEQSREMMIGSISGKGEDLRKILTIIKEFNQAGNEMKSSLISVLPIELAIVNITSQPDHDHSVEPRVIPAAPVPAKKKIISDLAPATNEMNEKAELLNNDADKIMPLPAKEDLKNENEQEISDKKESLTNDQVGSQLEAIKSNREGILQESKKYNHFLTAILSGAEFAINPEKGLVLKVSSSFYKKQLDSPETRKQLNKIIASVTGINAQFECIIDKTFKVQKAKSSNAKLVEELLS